MKRITLTAVNLSIIPALLLVQAARMVGAFVTSDMQVIPGWLSDTITALTAAGAIAQGVVFVAGQIVMVDNWRRNIQRLSSRRMVILTAVIVATAILEAVIQVPYIHGRMTGASIAEVEWLAWSWAVAVVLAPTLVLFGVMLCNVVADTQQAKPSKQEQVISGAEGAPITIKYVDSKLEAEPILLEAEPEQERFACEVCQAEFDTQRQLSGHMGGKHGKGAKG